MKELLRRDLSTTPLETALFLFIIFGFFGLLIILYKLRKKKERRHLEEVREDKWQQLCRKYNLSDEEKTFLEELAVHLKMPEKKYLLLADGKTFHHALQVYTEDKRPDSALVKSITKKTGMREAKSIITAIPTQRRRNARIKVDIDAFIGSIEKETAHMRVHMFDLSKGGCRTENPMHKFNFGDDVKITFTYKDKKYKDIPAEVVRTSSGRKILHLSFGPVHR